MGKGLVSMCAKEEIMKIYLKAFLIVLMGLSQLAARCGNDDDAGADSDTDSDSDGFLGSCTDEQIPEAICLDYYVNYELSQVEDYCEQSSDTFSTESCAANNASWTKIPGACRITDNYDASDGISIVSYYTGFYDEGTALAHCNAYQSITGFSSEWIDD